MGAAAADPRDMVVANKTAATPQLLQEVGRRGRAGPCTFALCSSATRPTHRSAIKEIRLTSGLGWWAVANGPTRRRGALCSPLVPAVTGAVPARSVAPGPRLHG
jgi:hypothetical protein